MCRLWASTTLLWIARTEGNRLERGPSQGNRGFREGPEVNRTHSKWRVALRLLPAGSGRVETRHRFSWKGLFRGPKLKNAPPFERAGTRLLKEVYEVTPNEP